MAVARTVWVVTAPNRLERNFVVEGTRTVVLGPSNGECAWNDSIISHTKNFCLSGTSLGVSYNTLKWIVEYNKVQIDTVIVCASINSIVNFEDRKLPFPNSWEEINSVLDYKCFLSFVLNKTSFWENALTSLPIWWFRIRELGGHYQYIERDKLNHPNAYDGINSILERFDGKYGVSEKKLYDRCKYQIFYLNKIKKYCDDHDKTLIILSPPIYKYPDMLDDTGYRCLIRNELGDSALIADYSRFSFPDSTYYGDLEHTNFRGARYFSNNIAKEGLNLQYAIDYIK